MQIKTLIGKTINLTTESSTTIDYVRTTIQDTGRQVIRDCLTERASDYVHFVYFKSHRSINGVP
jgi:hypothetical protein